MSTTGTRTTSRRTAGTSWCGATPVTDASVHDSQVIEKILDPDNTAAKVWADKAYRSEEIEEMLEEVGYKSMIMRKGSRSKKLTKREKQGNGTKAKVRARVEHVLGAQANDMGAHDAAQHRGHAGTDAHRAEELGLQHAEAHSLGSCRRGQSLAAPAPAAKPQGKRGRQPRTWRTADPTRAVHRLKRPAAPQPSVKWTLFNQTSRPPHNLTRAQFAVEGGRRGGNKSRCPWVRRRWTKSSGNTPFRARRSQT